MPAQIENMNRRGKNYGHLYPSHHDHDQCCPITNAYTKLDHEHEDNQQFFWAPINA